MFWQTEIKIKSILQKLFSCISEPERVPAENDFSYDNVYLGLYNCEAEENNELSFHRGDVIYVLDKVDVHWWIGFLNGKVGLVPCSYLTEGFEH